jgi:aryl-alcohol dehydrogenase-like predicted oxidoreductase
MADGRYGIRQALAEMLEKVGGRSAEDSMHLAGLTAARIVDLLNGGRGNVPESMSLVPLGYWLTRMTRHFGGEPTTEDAVQAAAELLSTLRRPAGRGGSDTNRYLGDILKDVLDALPPDLRSERAWKEKAMPDLPKRQLGRTGLQVTTLGYGAMEIRGAPRGRDVSPEQAGRILDAVLDAGINYIDTSIDYGKSEELIGEFISIRRSEYYLASKCGCAVRAAPAEPGQRMPHVFTPENIRAGVEQSLRRMKTDYIDVMQFHASPSRETLEENQAVEVLQDLKREGKVRWIGMSGTLPNLVDHIRMGVFDVFQIPYSALQREHEEAIAAASQAGAGIVIRGGAARGGPGKEEGAFWEAWQRVGIDDLIGDMTRMEFILRFTYTNPDLDTTIVGTVNPDHLQANIDALLKGPLAPDLYEDAKRRLAEAGSKPEPVKLD